MLNQTRKNAATKKTVERKVKLSVRKVGTKVVGRKKMLRPAGVPVGERVSRSQASTSKKIIASASVTEVPLGVDTNSDINDYVEDLIKKARFEKEMERKKILILRVGVSVFMIFVAVVWIFNARSVFSRMEKNESEQIELNDWNRMTDDLSRQINDMKVGISDLKEVIIVDENIKRLKEELSAELSATSSFVDLATSSVVISDENISTSSDFLTSSTDDQL